MVEAADTPTLCLAGGRAPLHNRTHMHAFKGFSETFDLEDKVEIYLRLLSWATVLAGNDTGLQERSRNSKCLKKNPLKVSCILMGFAAFQKFSLFFFFCLHVHKTIKNHSEHRAGRSGDFKSQGPGWLSAALLQPASRPALGGGTVDHRHGGHSKAPPEGSSLLRYPQANPSRRGCCLRRLQTRPLERVCADG